MHRGRNSQFKGQAHTVPVFYEGDAVVPFAQVTPPFTSEFPAAAQETLPVSPGWSLISE